MKIFSKIMENETGAVGWRVLWAIGLPVPIFTRAVLGARLHMTRNNH